MTLVELLVVVAILGLLAVAVLPILSNTADARRTREATRIITSYIAKAHSRAIGKTEWAGFWLAPPASNTAAPFAIDLFMASVPTAYRGNTPAATITVVSGSTLTTGLPSAALGDLIRFDGQPPWYEMVSGTSFRLRGDNSFLSGSTADDDAGHTSLNTPWPAYTPFNASPGNIAALFDGTGRLRQLYWNGTRVNVSGPLFLLIGRTDRAGQSMASLSTSDDSLGANWQYSDSFWIGIDPLSGIAKSAECKPSATSVVDSQEFIRSEILATGR
jgi:type II secretory pathway pseudopilin PulG